MIGKTSVLLAACAAAAMALGGSSAARAQTQKVAAAKTAPVYRAPRGPDGKHPDLNGIWQVMNTAGWNLEPHPSSAALELRPGPVTPVPAKAILALGAVGAVPGGPGVVIGGTIPYKPEALKQRDDNRAHYLARDPEVKCYLPGVPRATYMDKPFQIFQSDSSMLIAYEYDSAARNILFKDPGPAPADSWMGQSVAHWEGDTLVVKVTDLNDQTWLDRAGNFHSDQMSVIERYTPVGPGLMKYEAEITDPETFTRPWKIEMMLYKHVGPDARLDQFKCVEFVTELMYGDLRKEPLK
jgi:hypothetical protein